MSGFGDLTRLNSGVQSLDARNSLNRVNRSMSRNDLAMATGLRINSSEDDPAGYAIVSKLRGRTAGLLQALVNTGDARSVLEIVDTGFGQIIDTLTEMKILSTRGAQDTIGEKERIMLGEQIVAYGGELNSIAARTVFIGQELLKGFESSNKGVLELIFQVGEREQDVLFSQIAAVNVGMLFNGAGEDNFEGDTQLGAREDAITVTALSLLTKTEPGQLQIETWADAGDFRVFISAVDDALQNMLGRVNDLGSSLSSLRMREDLLSNLITANEAAASRIMDADFAALHSKSIRLMILQQTSTLALAQANVGKEAVLDLIARHEGIVPSAGGTSNGSGIGAGGGFGNEINPFDGSGNSGAVQAAPQRSSPPSRPAPPPQLRTISLMPGDVDLTI
jgi:flagellin